MKKTFCIMFISVVSVLMGFAQDDRQLIREGNKLYRSGQYAQAETKYRKALEKNAGNVRASYNLGCALMKQGKTEEADKQFSLVASSSQADKEFRSKNYYNKGVMYQSKKEYEKAIATQKEADALRQQYDDSLRQLEEERKETLRTARRNADAEYQRIVGSAEEKAASIKSDAQIQAESTRQQVLKRAEREIADMVLEAATKITGDATEGKQINSALYDEFLSKAGDRQ